MRTPKTLSLLALIAASAFLGSLYICHTAESFLYEISPAAPFHPCLVESEAGLLDDAFSQRFTYLGKGHQCVAYESQDRRYVLKFPYHSQCLPPSWMRFIPFLAEKVRTRKVLKKKQKLQKDASSYLLAFDHFKQETGLLYIHLNKTATLNRILHVKDKKGREHALSLDRMEFILQKKAKLVYPALAEWMSLEQPDLAKEALSNLVSFFRIRSEKGIQDPEQSFEGNFGFIETDPIQIDIGRLKTNSQPVEKEKIASLLLPLKEKLEVDYPELANHLEQELLLWFQKD